MKDILKKQEYYYNLVLNSDAGEALAKQILEYLLKDEPDVMRIRDLVRILGIGKSGIDKWIVLGRLKVFSCRGRIHIAKEDLISYLSSPFFLMSPKKNEFKQALKDYPD